MSRVYLDQRGPRGCSINGCMFLFGCWVLLAIIISAVLAFIR